MGQKVAKMDSCVEFIVVVNTIPRIIDSTVHLEYRDGGVFATNLIKAGTTIANVDDVQMDTVREGMICHYSIQP
jgi:hypothetical protein